MKAILSIFLMLQIVFSSMSLNISMHYCLGELADVGILSKAEVCSFEKYFESDNNPDDCEIKNKSCCGQENHLISGQEHNTTIKSQLNVKSEKIIRNNSTFLPLLFSLNEISTRNITSPPLIEPPIFLQVQSFRL